jgi:hypothetical protein
MPVPASFPPFFLYITVLKGVNRRCQQNDDINYGIKEHPVAGGRLAAEGAKG